MTHQHDTSSQADLAFTELATAYLDDTGERLPEFATALGDHRFDAHLPVFTQAALDAERQALEGFTARLAAIDHATLSPENQVDAAMLGTALKRRMYEREAMREHTWNPLVANPGRAIRLLLARDFAPLPERLASVAGRLAEVPGALAGARNLLGPMPRVHLETAIGQFTGTISLVTKEIDQALEDAQHRSGATPALRQCAAQIGAVRPAALEALDEHRAWLSAKLDEGNANGGFADPRTGPERFARKLSLTLDAEADDGAILARALADLDRVSEEMAGLAAGLAGPASGTDRAAVVRQVLGSLAADAPDDKTILELCRGALAQQAAFVTAHKLVTVHDDPVDLIEMPEVDRGVAVAYCDSPGPLEPRGMPTFVAVSPTPAAWPAERVASFYREYNRHMVHNLMIHEAMPGHFVQLGHSRRFTGTPTPLRSALRSGSFVEGWAVYAEELMAIHEYPGLGDPRKVRMQQLKMQLRMIMNAILDAGVHTQGMTEAEAMSLMTGRGFQEEGEAAGKWRRAQLTSTQLSTYYVGYTEVADLAAELKAASPGQPERELHDRMLAHGTPPVRRLRTLVS